MKVLEVRNVHQALPRGLRLLEEEGIPRDSRVGRVLVAPSPVATVYSHPSERVVLWPQRDYNVAFALYEALWMLAGRRDTAPLDRYVHDYTSRFSDDGINQHGAYGHRWRHHFGMDQLALIADDLKKNADHRRSVLQMWDPGPDLDRHYGKDVPCNLSATFQRGRRGELNLVVFCRSNDIIYGAYYANAFHFSLLLEYMARWIGCEVGTYTQISVNYHAYYDVMQKLEKLPRSGGDYMMSNPYYMDDVMPTVLPIGHDWIDAGIKELLTLTDSDFHRGQRMITAETTFFKVAEAVLYAHYLWKHLPDPLEERFLQAYRVVSPFAEYDLANSMMGWLKTRKDKYLAKLIKEDVG